MVNFNFSLDELTGDNPDAAIGREMGKTFVGGKPFQTSVSAFGGSKSFETLSLGEIMMGSPSINGRSEAAGFNERGMSTMLTGSLMHLDKAESNPGVGRVNPAVDFLIPPDVKAESETALLNIKENQDRKDVKVPKIGARIDDEGIDDIQSLIDGKLNPKKNGATNGGSAGTGTGTGTGWEGGDPSGNVIYKTPDFPVGADGKVDTSALRRMPNFQKARFSGNGTEDEIKSGFMRPEVYKMLSYLCQQLVPSFTSAFRSQAENNAIYGRVQWSNHIGRGAVDIGAFAWPNSPDNFVRVDSGASCNPYLDMVYKILNSMTGLERPDEVIGPTYHPTSSEGSRMWTNSAHHDHVHVGYNYRSAADGEARSNILPDDIIESLPHMDITDPPPPTAPGGGSGGSPSPNAQAYIDKILPLVRREAQRTHIPESVMLAQSGNETGWGTSDWFVKYNNPAGIGVTGAPGKGLKYANLDEAFYDYAQKLLGIGEWGQGPFVQGVMEKVGPVELLIRLAASPWAGSRYDSATLGPGGSLVRIWNDMGLGKYDTV